MASRSPEQSDAKLGGYLGFMACAGRAGGSLDYGPFVETTLNLLKDKKVSITQFAKENLVTWIHATLVDSYYEMFWRNKCYLPYVICYSLVLFIFQMIWDLFFNQCFFEVRLESLEIIVVLAFQIFSNIPRKSLG